MAAAIWVGLIFLPCKTGSAPDAEADGSGLAAAAQTPGE